MPEGEWGRSQACVQNWMARKRFPSPGSVRGGGKEGEVGVTVSRCSFRFSGRLCRRGSWLEVVTSCQTLLVMSTVSGPNMTGPWRRPQNKWKPTFNLVFPALSATAHCYVDRHPWVEAVGTYTRAYVWPKLKAYILSSELYLIIWSIFSLWNVVFRSMTWKQKTLLLNSFPLQSPSVFNIWSKHSVGVLFLCFCFFGKLIFKISPVFQKHGRVFSLIFLILSGVLRVP